MGGTQSQRGLAVKYQISAKDKATIYYLLKALSENLKLSRKMKTRMRTLRLKFPPGDAPVDLRPRDRDSVLGLLRPLALAGIARGSKDKDLIHQICRVIKILEDSKVKPKPSCSSTSNTQT